MGFLISDVVMPRFSGIELAAKVKAILPECKILLLSGQADTKRMLDEARANGKHFDIIAKPIHPTDLLRRVGLELGTVS